MEESARSRRESVYKSWQKGEGIPIYTGSYLTDLYTANVTPWARIGQRGAFVNLADQEQDDAYILEIAPGQQTERIHHLFEAGIFVLSGRGATTFWQEGGSRQTVEWQRGSFFSPPLNCYYQHYNLDGQQPTRIFVVTNAPMIMNLFRSSDFVFDDRYVFADRYGGEDSYFSDAGHAIHEQLWKTNFVPDIRSFTLRDNPGRGVGNIRMGFLLANNQMAAHCSDFPPGKYKMGHRHGVGAHVIVLNGLGYSLLWFEGETERRKAYWKDGSVLSPKEGEYHQHFNTGPTPARYLAFRLGSLDTQRSQEDRRPQQIDYTDEDPAIYEDYVAECERHGAKVDIPQPAYRR
ncbi:MAG: ethanolamine ammonia lyase-activating protein [Chloroflexi bacterium]|nr:ethanolamine ammonia lyase-activating protein [Chloroflexota bacterium]